MAGILLPDYTALMHTHRIDLYDIHGNLQALVASLDKTSAEGWELVSVLPMPYQESPLAGAQQRLIFMAVYKRLAMPVGENGAIIEGKAQEG